MRKRKVQAFFNQLRRRWSVRPRFFVSPIATPQFSVLPKFLTLRETAKILNVHPNTLRSWDAQGKLRAVRFGTRQDRRYLRDDVAAAWTMTLRRQPQPRIHLAPLMVRRLGWGFGAMVLLFIIVGASWSRMTALADEPGTTQISAAPGSCEGWTNASNALRTDLPTTADFEIFTTANSARISTSNLGISGNTGTMSSSFDQVTPQLDCEQFTVQGKKTGGISAVQLRVTLGTKAAVNSTDTLRISTSFDGQSWEQLANEPVRRDEQRAITIDLPSVTDLQQLQQLRVRLEPEFALDGASEVAVDGVRLIGKITSAVAPVTTVSTSDRKKELDRLTAFSQSSYESTDQPTITIPKKQTKTQFIFGKKTEEWKLKDVALVDLKGVARPVDYRTADETVGDDVRSRVRLRMSNQHPGKYLLRVTMISPTGSTEVVEEPFLWGVLAMNLRRANPAVNDRQEVTIAVLDDGGRTICDARVRAVVTNPKGKKTTVDTKNKSITTNPDCIDKGVTNEADYHFSIPLDLAGVYRVTIEAETLVGDRKLVENFVVEQTSAFDVERVDYPTRIYPVAPYPVRIAITPEKDYVGLVTEEVPTNFVIADVFPAATVRTTGTTVSKQFIEWLVEWKAGQTYFLTYTFDAPDISPALFLTGPLTIGGSFIAAADFQESRQWQIASDALTGTGMLAYNEDGANNTTPHYRTWDGSNFSNESQMQDDEDASDQTNYTVIKSAPTRNEYIAARLISLGELDVQVYDGPTAAWVNGTSAPTNGDFTTGIGTTNDIYRGYDVAYEAQTGDGIVVYESSSTGDGLLKYRTWDGSAWSAEADIDYSAVDEGNDVAVWVVCQADYDSDNILCAWQEATGDGIYGARWDGSAWQHIAAINLAGGIAVQRTFDVAWQGNGEGMVYYATGTSVDASEYIPGSGWSDTASAAGPATNTQKWINIAGSPNNDYIAVTYYENTSNAAPDFGVDMWNGSNWTTVGVPTEDSDTNNVTAEGGYGFANGADVAWERGGGDRALFVWRDGTKGETAVMTMVYDISAAAFQVIDNNSDCLLTEGAAGTVETVTSLDGVEDSAGPCLTSQAWADRVSGMQLSADPSSDKIMLVAEDMTAALVPEAQLWNGDANGTWLAQTANMSGFELDAANGATLSTTNISEAYSFAFRESYEANVHTSGSQTSSLAIPSTTQHVGGMFTINQSQVTANITSIKITEQGTVNGTTGVDNIYLTYKSDTSAPYNCSGETYSGSVQYGSTTDTDGFDAANGSSTFTGSVAVTPTSTLCIFVVLDITSSAADGETLEIQITNPSTDIVVSAGGIGPTFARALSGTTTLSLPFTISGTCKAFDQTTNCGDLGTIKYADDATLDNTNVDTGGGTGGTFTISGASAPASGSIITVFVDGAAGNGDKAVAITKYDGSGSISGLLLYKEHLTIGSSDTGATLTSAELGSYDNSVSASDVDVFHDYNGTTTFTVDSTGFSTQEELYIQSGWTYRPDSGGGDTVNTHDLEIVSTGVLNVDTNALNISGSYVNAGTLTKAATQTTTFTSTTTETITPGTGNFANVTFNGSGGQWTPSAALNIDEALSMTAGTLAGTQNVTVLTDVTGTAGVINLTGGTFEQRVGGTELFGPTTASTLWTFSTLQFSRSAGTAVIDTNLCATCTVTIAGQLLLSKSGDGAGTTLQAGDKTWSLTNTNQAEPFNNDGQAADAGTLTAETSTFDYAGDNNAGDVIIENATYNNLSLTSDGVAENFDAAGTSAVSGTLTTGANGTLTGTDDWSMVNVTSNGSINLSSTSTTTFTATGTVNGSGTRTFYNMTTSGTGTTTISSATNAGNNVSVGAGTTLKINANMTITGTITNTTTGVITQDAGTPTVTINGTASMCGGNASGCTFYNLTFGGASTTIGTNGFTVKNNLTLPASVTAGTNAITMTGTAGQIVGGGSTIYDLTIDPSSAGTITLATSDLTISNTLSIAASDTFDITGRTATLSLASGTALTLNGILSGSTGTLIYRTTTTFPTSGTLTTPPTIRFDTVNGNQSIPNRTDFGSIVAYKNGTTARSVFVGTAASQTVTLSGSLDVQNGNATGALTLDASSTNTLNPTVNIGTTFTTTVATGQVNVNMGSGTWTTTGHFDLTNVTTFSNDSGTVVLNGTSNLIGNSKTLNNLTVDGSGNTVTVTTSDISVAGTLTIGGAADSNDDTLSIASSRTLTSGTAGTVTINASGTTNAITGAGTLVVQNNNLSVNGTLSSIVRFDATDGNITIPARTFGGAVSVYIANTAAADRTVTLAASPTFQGALSIENNDNNAVTLSGTVNNPTIGLTGNFSCTQSGAGVVNLFTGTGTWTATGDVNFTNCAVDASGSTFILNGTSKTLTSAGQSLNNLTISGSITGSGDMDLTGNLLLSSGSLTAPASITVAGNWTNSGATFNEGTGTVLMRSNSTSTTLNSNCANPDSCSNENFYNLEINMTAAGDADDNVTLTTNGIRVTNTLTITDGELVQGALNVVAEGTTAVLIDTAGKWSNFSTGDIKIGGTATNNGVWLLDVGNNADGCSGGDTDDIALTTVTGEPSTQQSLAGTGTFTWYDVTVSWMNATVAITVNGGTNGGNNAGSFTFNACGITITGTIYSNAGSEASAVYNCNADNLTIHSSVAGGTTSNASCTAVGGTFSLVTSGPPASAGDPIVVWIDSGETPKATTVTLAADTSSNISGLILIQDRLILSHENAGPMTNAKLATGDNGNAGIRYSVTGSDLTVESGHELHVLAGKSFTPGGIVTTTATGTASGAAGDVHIPATATMTMGTNGLSVGGDLTNAGTLSLSSGQTTTMTATGSGFTITTGGTSLQGLTFNGASGNWTNSGALTVSEIWTGTAGGFTQANSTTITVNGTAFSLANGFTWTKATSGANLILENATNLDFTDSNTTKQDLGAVQIGASPGVTTLKSDMSATTVTIPTSDTFKTKGYEVTTSGAFDCQGTCTLDLTDTAPNNEGDGTILDVGGDFTMSSSATFTSYSNSKVFLNSTAGTDTNRTFTTGGKAYNEVELKNAGGTNDDITISGNLDVNSVLTLTDGQIRLDTNDPNVTTAGNLVIASGATVTKADNGTATWTFDGSGTSTWTDSTASGGQDIGLVTINGTTKTINLGSDAKATKLTIAASQTFGLGSSGYTFTLTGSGQTTARPFQNSGTLNEGTNSIVKFTGTAATDVDPETWYHLTVAPSGAGSPTYAFDPGESGTTVVSGNFLIGDSTNAVTASFLGITGLDINGNLTISANSTFVSSGDTGMTIGGSYSNSGTLTDGGAGIVFDATTTGKTLAGTMTGSSKFLAISFNGSGGEWTNTSTLEANSLQMTAGTLLGTADITINEGLAGTAGVITRTGGTVTVRNSTSNNFGPTTASTTWTFNDLTFGNSHASTPLTVTTQNCSSCVMAVTGVLRVGKSGDAAGATTTLTGATTTWTLTGTSADPFILLSSPAGAFTANTSTVNYNGVNGSGNVNITNTTYSGLGCSPGSAEVADVATGFTVSGTLTVGSNCTLTIATSQTLTHSGTTLTLNGTINGAGRYTYQSSTALPATGTLSSILRMDATNNAQSITCSVGGRTLGGAVEFYSNSGVARSITICGTTSHILNITGAVTVEAAGAGALTVEANTYDPAINITGNFTAGTTGGGTETISLGSGTWTMSGNVSFANAAVSNNTGNTIYMNGTGGKTMDGNNLSFNNLTFTSTGTDTIYLATSTVNLGGVLTVGANTTLSSAVTINFSTSTCSVSIDSTGTITGAGAMWYACTTNFPSTGTYSLAQHWYISYYGDQTITARSYGGATLFRILNNSGATRTVTLGAGTLSVTAPFNIFTNASSNLAIDGATNSPTVNITGDFTVTNTGAETRTLSTGTGNWTFAGNVTLTNLTTLTATTNNTFTMTGSSKTLTTAGQSLYNFTQSGGSTTMSGTTTLNNNLLVSSGTLTAPSAGALNVGGNFTNSATFTHNNSTVTMTGSNKNIVGGSTTFYNLTIDPAAATQTINAITNNFTVSNGLTIAAGDTLALEASRLISVTSTAEITWGDSAATISGSGVLRFTSASGGPGTGGTLSSGVRFDASTSIASTTIDARTYSGAVEMYKLVTAARTVTLASGSYTFGSLLMTGNADVNPGNLALVGSTGNPTVAVTGDVSGTDHGGAEDHTINMGSGVWTVSGNFNLTFITTFTHNSGTLAMNGTSKVLTLDGQSLNNFQVTGGTVSVADTNITVAGTVTLSSGTFTAPSGTMSVAGNWTNSGGSFAPNNGTVSFNGGGTQTVTTANVMSNVGCGGSAITQTSNKQFYNFVVAGGTVVLATNSDLGVDGTFQITSGSFDIKASDANYLYIKGNLDLDAVTGTAFNMRESTWTGGCGQVIMNGAAATQRIYVQAGQTYNVHSITFGDISATERTYYLSSSTASAATFRFQEYAIILSGTVDTKDGSQGTVNFNWTGTGQGDLYVGDDFGEHSATTKVFNANDATLSLGGIIVSDGQVSNGKPSTFNAMTSTITMTGGTTGWINIGNSAQPTRDDNTFDASTATTNAIALKAVNIAVGDLQATSNRPWTLTDTSSGGTLTLLASATLNATGSTSTWLMAGGMTVDAGATFTAGSTTFTQNGTGAAVIDSDTDLTFNNLTFDDTGTRTITFRDVDTSGRRFAVSGTFTWDQTVAANAVNITLGSTSFTMTLALDNATVANSTMSIPSGKTLSFTNASTLELAGDFVNAGTLSESTGKILMDGTNSSIINTGCATPAACTSQNLYNLEINKTAAGAGDDNVTVTTNGINVANTLTITDGEMIQGALDIRVEGATAVSIATNGTWTNISTGDLTLGGTFTNAGTATFNSNNGSQCVDGANDIVINSTVADTTRLWTNTGTLALYNVEADDMTNASITAYNSDLTDPQTTWVAGSCGITVSGTIYQTGNESSGYGCNADNLTLYVAVNGDATPDTGTCTAADGTFSISNATDPGAADIPVVLYIDTGESVKATTVTLSSAAATNITGLTVIIDRVVVTHQASTVMTNAYMNTADNGNAGIRYAVSAGALTVESGMELHVLSGKTFTPGGTVTTTATGTAAGAAGDLHIAGTMTMGTNALTVGGDYNNAGTLNKTNPQTTTLAATGSGFTITPGTGSYNNLTVSGDAGGNGTYTLSGADLTVDGTLTVNTGDTLTIDTSRTLTNTGSTDVNNDGTISGAGKLTFTNASGGPDSDANSTGTYSSIVRYDATSGNVASTTFDARTYSGVLELYNNSTTSRTITAASGTYTTSGASSHFHVRADGNGEVTVDASANNPTMVIAGDLDFVGTGAGTEIVAAGTGTWTVSGNVNLTDGMYAPLISALSPTWDQTATKSIYWSDCDISLSTDYTCQTASNTTGEIGIDDTYQSCNGDPAGSTIDHRFGTKYSLAGISNTATILGEQLFVDVNTAIGDTVQVRRGTSDSVDTANCTTSAMYQSIGTGTVYGSSTDFGTTGPKRIQIDSLNANAEIQTRLTGSDVLPIGMFVNTGSFGGSGLLNTVNGGTDTAPVLRIGYVDGGSPTLLMNGASKTLTSAGNTLFNVSITGSVTLANETHYIAGNLDLTGSTITAGSSIMYMIGGGKTLTPASQTLNQLTIDPTTAGTITMSSSDLNVSTALIVATSDTLSLDANRTLTLTPATGSPLTLNGTISGSGRLTYKTNAAFPSGGIISSTLRYDATSATSQIITSRTYGGPVEIYNNSGGAKTVASGSGTMAFSSTLDLSVGSGSVTLDLNTTDPTTTTVTGALTIGANSTLSAPSTNGMNINGNYTNNGTFTDNSGTVTLAGSAQQTLSGTMTGSSDFNNLIVTNASGSDPESSPSVIFSTAASTAATFTATTANTKLRFNAGSTYTFVNVSMNGQAVGTRVFLRSSTPGTQWNLTSTGTQTVSNTNVRDSYACGGDTVDASDGTSFDAGKNDCWSINTISLTISDTTIGFGACTPNNARYATSDATGSNTDSSDAHTLSVATNARSGYNLTIAGSTLTGSAGTITAIGGSALASSIGTEQFGLRAVKNSGTGTVSSPFDTANWAFTAGATQPIASYTGANSSYSAVYGVRYICNVSGVTEAGSYATDLTYVLTSTF